MRKRHDEKMRAMHDAGNDRIRLAKVRLGMTRRVRQRHEHLPQTKVPFANVILHDRLLAREAMFVTKTLEDPLRRVPLLAVNRAILFQNAVDDIRERRQLRALRRLASPISRRFRMQQYLGNRLAIDPELARSFPSAQTLTMTRQSHSSIKIHSVHPPPSIRSILTKAIDGPILVRRRNRTNRPLHWGIIAPPFSQRWSAERRHVTWGPTPMSQSRGHSPARAVFVKTIDGLGQSVRRQNEWDSGGDYLTEAWRSFEAVEIATLEWLDWFNNRRLLEPIGNIPPAEAEERHYAMLEQSAMAA